MRRINVIGTTGSGKTTVARELATRLRVPHVELDALHWGPNWTIPSREEFRARVAKALTGDSWVIDGNYGKVRDIVWTRADTLVWLDYALPLILRPGAGQNGVPRDHGRAALERESRGVRHGLQPRWHPPMGPENLSPPSSRTWFYRSSRSTPTRRSSACAPLKHTHRWLADLKEGNAGRPACVIAGAEGPWPTPSARD